LDTHTAGLEREERQKKKMDLEDFAVVCADTVGAVLMVRA
jgi:hypothetical protein